MPDDTEKELARHFEDADRRAAVERVMAALREPFPADAIDWRVGRENKEGAKVSLLAYVDSRAVQERFDSECGIDGWASDMVAGDKGVICRLSLRMPDSSWVTRADGADYSDIEGFKGGISGALKRAAAQWGVGRYLYNLPETWVALSEQRSEGAIYHKGKFAPRPILPAWALPGGTGRPPNGNAKRGQTPASSSKVTATVGAAPAGLQQILEAAGGNAKAAMAAAGVANIDELKALPPETAREVIARLKEAA
jgi:hypothetical protein